MKEIPLTQGKVALIDDEDYDRVSKYEWHAHQTEDGHWYAKTLSGSLSMHRFIMNPKDDELVDHINFDGLDNRRSNLCIVTGTQNNANRRKQANTSSIYKGVYWDKSRNKWIASIHYDYTQYYLGRFDNEKDAAIAYDKAALKFFGEYAHTNF